MCQLRMHFFLYVEKKELYYNKYNKLMTDRCTDNVLKRTGMLAKKILEKEKNIEFKKR